MATIPRVQEHGRFWTGPLEYALPPELIAQRPVSVRSDARLMVVDRDSGRIDDRRFADLPSLLASGDLVIANDTAVFPARLAATKPTGGAAEILLLSLGARHKYEHAHAIIRSSKPVRAGQRLELADGSGLHVVAAEGGGRYRVRFEGGDAAAITARLGQVPLPPYIERPGGTSREDAERYQTVYAREQGSVAAPTAGLHFTPELIEQVRAAGAAFDCITLHVGPGTFTPVRGGVDSHQMEPEWCEVGERAARAVADTHANGGRVIAVGTTTVRALESAALQSGTSGEMPGPWRGSTSLFIRPGHRFRAIDALVTNFHLPGSTLLCLVLAFGGEEPIRAAYERAVRDGYRFYSYGDAMLVT